MTIDEAKRAAEGMYRGACVVADYMDEVDQNLIETVMETSEREEQLQAVWHRAIAWMKSVKKLNDPTDFQALVSCNRALLEMTVDMILLSHDRTDESRLQVFWWEKSSKLKSAELLQKYYKGDVPEAYQEQVDFIAREGEEIRKMRAALWPNRKGKHPERWTGRSSLYEDVMESDRLYLAEIENELDVGLTEFHETEYRRMNWNVHGSATAGIRGIPPIGFHYLCGLTYKWCSDLALLCAKIILTDFHFTKYLDDLSERWRWIRDERMVRYADAVGWLDRRR